MELPGFPAVAPSWRSAGAGSAAAAEVLQHSIASGNNLAFAAAIMAVAVGHAVQASLPLLASGLSLSHQHTDRACADGFACGDRT